MTLSVQLGLQLESVVDGLVEAGGYNSKSEVLRQGARLVQEREARMAALDAAILSGVADVDSGRASPAEEVFERLRARYEAISTAES